ncbi:hypothetical protein TBLA_0I03380 [Henningerozyma blattae CBS 6284]|uniref:XPG-I domain-containing protein n=1 Tax=Henningerozyma blattae (strain ATCC 34711 / CBS 6284 / DSM 70876 / NBRC 10599 / NRRL Y-10934 / UCD 77-7) TaxID=1071380 RepID=I2H9E0_HENB6|nr:hypothetical protein TBLA_0I03380 [Tetrapisispora blattae CBS 6284]CCH62992.1 hypothetical protein TBLA_0I03380 [Tetrapisispora blattae CBS 6284]
MGVPPIWEILKPFIQDSRIPLKVFVSEFYKKNNQFPRIAIDGYTWLFECGFIVKIPPKNANNNNNNNNENVSYISNSKAMTNFVYRLKELLSLNIEMVFVFDGNLKPWFKNKYKSEKDYNILANEKDNDYLELYNDHLKSHQTKNQCLALNDSFHEPSFLKSVKKLLDHLNIPYLQACGEGEAQCAWLNINRYVHYVLANDSDTLMFGCKNMLRNFSKFWDDKGATAGSGSSPEKHRDNKEYFVTVINMDEVQKQSIHRIDRWSLLFFSVLLGADYNDGVKGLGKVKAAKLSYSTAPDFSLKFRKIFENIDQEKKRRIEKYDSFKKEVFEYCKNHSVQLFGRNYKTLLGEDAFEGWPIEYVVMFYFHPYLLYSVEDWMRNLDFDDCTECKIDDLEKIQFSSLHKYLRKGQIYGVTNFDRWFHSTMHESFLLRYIWLNNSIDKKIMKITEEKTTSIGNSPETLVFYKVRYNSFLEGIEYDETMDISRSSSPSKSPSKSPIRPSILKTPGKSPSGSSKKLPIRSRSPTRRQMDIKEYKFGVWILKDLIPKNHTLVLDYNKRMNEKTLQDSQKKTRSPRKKKYSQKNTLDGFLSKHSSPSKSSSPTKTLHTSTNKLQLNKDSFVPSKPVKRQLFIDIYSSDSEHGSQHLSTKVEAKDDSLVILEDYKIDNDISDISPTKSNQDLGCSTQELDVQDESPLKRQRLVRNSSLLDQSPNTISSDKFPQSYNYKSINSSQSPKKSLLIPPLTSPSKLETNISIPKTSHSHELQKQHSTLSSMISETDDQYSINKNDPLHLDENSKKKPISTSKKSSFPEEKILYQNPVPKLTRGESILDRLAQEAQEVYDDFQNCGTLSDITLDDDDSLTLT